MKVTAYTNNKKNEVIELSIAIFDVDMAEKFGDPECISLIAVEDGKIIGLIGGIPNYGNTGWELHPLGVYSDYKKNGVGRALVNALEKEVKRRGGVMIYLGADDENNQTSLSQTNLFVDTYNKMANVMNYGNHPYSFYEKLGYKIVGVIPDANGVGKPDIMMAKSLA